ncbi:hypothetical protein [Actinospongicola halichondriae]|uniref:hypothetical protein n=1 Tax=Actinospongicola halichondriae TaxID=3236844 RepID=UPI003D5AE1B7
MRTSMPPEGSTAWQTMLTADRKAAADLDPDTIPTSPGVYAWFRDDAPVYAGRAVAKYGLKGRLKRNHLATGLDLSHSSFRRNVCEHLLGIATSVTRQRPTVMTEEQVSVVNAWIRECDVTWVTFETGDEAKDFEKTLLGDWMPPFSKR